MFNSNNAAAVEALKAAFPLLRPAYNYIADMLDQASRGYEARLTANPIRGLRLRATFSKTAREREDLFQFTLPRATQLRAYIADLQSKNPGVNISNLTSSSDPTTTIGSLLDALDQRLDNAIDTLGNNFGGGKMNANVTATYDFQERLKGWGLTGSTRYRSGAYTGAYEIREGGIAGGRLVQTVPRFGQSTIDFDLSIRYRTRITWLKNTRATFQLNVANVVDESDPIVRRIATVVVAPDAAPPPAVPTSYFIRTPRSWSLTSKFDF